MVTYLGGDADHAIVEVVAVFDTGDHEVASASEFNVGREDSGDLEALAVWTGADWRLRLGDRLAFAGTGHDDGSSVLWLTVLQELVVVWVLGTWLKGASLTAELQRAKVTSELVSAVAVDGGLAVAVDDGIAVAVDGLVVL